MHPADVAGIILFSGIGGSSHGAHLAGIKNTVSVEWDAAIAAAANENGINTVCADIRTLDPETFAFRHFRFPLLPKYLFLQASPPCTSFSPAGKQKGRNDLPVLEAILREIGELPRETVVERIAHYRGRVADECAAETSALSIEPMLWIAALMPDFVSFEQVIQVLPFWEVCAEVLEKWGYYTWTGNVSAEQHGVPQTRKRAYLLGSLHGEVSEPPATHSKYYPRSPEKLDEGLPKWISMAEALAVDPDGRLIGTQIPRGETERHSRSTSSPAQTLTRHGGSYQLEATHTHTHTHTGTRHDDATELHRDQRRSDDRGSGAVREGSPRRDEEGDGARGVGRVMISNYGTGGDARNRGRRLFTQPAPTVTSKIDRNRIEAAA